MCDPRGQEQQGRGVPPVKALLQLAENPGVAVGLHGLAFCCSVCFSVHCTNLLSCGPSPFKLNASVGALAKKPDGKLGTVTIQVSW